MSTNFETKSETSPVVTLQESKEDVEGQEQQRQGPLLEVWFPIALPFCRLVADGEPSDSSTSPRRSASK